MRSFATSSAKLILGVFAFFALPPLLKAEDDPFAKRRTPSSVTEVAWESVAVKPESYFGKVISLSGWLEVTLKEGILRMRLYKDHESYLSRRSMANIILADAEEFHQHNAEISPLTWRLLDGKEVELWGVWSRENNLVADWGAIGQLSGPYEILIRGRNGEPIDSIKDNKAVWQQ